MQQTIPIAAVQMANDEVVMMMLERRLEEEIAQAQQAGLNLNTAQAIISLSNSSRVTRLQMLALQLRHHVI